MMMKKLANNSGLNDNCSGKQLINTTYNSAGKCELSRKTPCRLMTDVRKKACKTTINKEATTKKTRLNRMVWKAYKNSGKAFSVLLISGLGRMKTHITMSTKGSMSRLTKWADLKKLMNTEPKKGEVEKILTFATNLS
jgi:hypothetical protein